MLIPDGDIKPPRFFDASPQPQETQDWRKEAERIVNATSEHPDCCSHPDKSCWEIHTDDITTALEAAYKAGEAKKGEHGRKMYQNGVNEGKGLVLRAVEQEAKAWTPYPEELVDAARRAVGGGE